MNIPWLRHSIVHEDLAQGRESLRRVSNRAFETAVFGHGSPIQGHADQKFRDTFGVEVHPGTRRS